MLLSLQYFAGVSHNCGVRFSWPERLHVVSSEVTACSRLLRLCFIRTRELVSRYAHPQRYRISNTFFGVLYRFVIAEREGVVGSYVVCSLLFYAKFTSLQGF